MKPEIQYVLEYLDDNNTELAATLRRYIEGVDRQLSFIQDRLTTVVAERDKLAEEWHH